MKQIKYLAEFFLPTIAVTFVGLSNAHSKEDYSAVIANLPCARVTSDDLAYMSGELYRNGQAFGVPKNAWNESIALQFRTRLAFCDGQNPQKDLALARHFDLIWPQIGPQIERERAEIADRDSNSRKIESAFSQIDASASPDEVLNQLSNVERLMQMFSLSKNDRAKFESHLAELRAESNQQKIASEALRHDAQLAEEAAAAARREEEEASALEAKLADMKEKARLSAEAKQRQELSTKNNLETHLATQEKLETATDAQRAARQRRSAAETELAKLQQEELALQQADAASKKEAAVAARLANPSCVAADAMKKEMVSTEGEAEKTAETKLMDEITTLAMEMQAGEIAKGCRRARLLEEKLEKWRSVTAECSLSEAMPINMSIEPLRRMQIEYGC